ncbi:MAG: amino acid adenylation domain-containing protein [Iphinoe sp. HA4291-MV1]|jgi:amino acid adenylation domain-containing protein|nr:amino acid adenylation domain-containing protein [Iphinoe sp. HA4291-MV1]
MKNIEDFYPLSPMQQGILFHTLYAPHSGVYCEQLSCTIAGDFNVSAFQQAWQQIIERHPILRTTFVWEGLKEPAQLVHKQVKLSWEQQDWRGLASVEQQEQLEAFLKTDRDRGFELSQAPLMRLTLVQLAENDYQFIWSHHHLLLDGWSSSRLLDEIFAFYKAFNQDQNLDRERPRPYRDYIAWLQQQDSSQNKTFWQQRLKGFTEVTPFKVDQTPSHLLNQDNKYDKQLLELSTTETAALQSLARQQQLTLNTLIQGAWAILLSRYSGEKDVIFGGVVSGRSPTLAGTESMVGVFINTLPVRVYVNLEESLLLWLKQLQAQQNETRQYEYSPLVEVQKWSDLPAGQPLFESILNFQNYSINFLKQQQVGNIKISNIDTSIHPHYPLTVSVKADSELSLEIFYDCHRFDTGTITRMLGHLQALLLSMVANPQQRLINLSLLTSPERHQLLVEWNNTQVDYPQDQCIHQLFEAQVELTPDAVAVVFEEEQLTYRELNRQANQLARYLQKVGVEPLVLMGICTERSLDMVIGVLGILKAGGAYVPLDPAYPHERLAFMLEDAKVSVLLTQKKLVAALPEHKAKVVCLDTDWQEIVEQSNSYSINEATTKDLAYVIYTSGSTGKPKGVQISHGALVNFLSAMRQNLKLTKEDILLSVTTLSFDIAALELYLPLIVGARLVLVSREIAVDGTKLLERLTLLNTTIMQATPASWRLLLSAGWQDNRQLKILCGGEALDRSLANQLLERGTQVWNLYGPTETTIWSSVRMIESNPDQKERDNIISIGRPIANTQFYILDSHQQPVPVGVPGELHIGGVGLARGYLNQPELTAQKFIPNPFHNEQGARLYKTGDLVRYQANGNLEFLGRIDHQVKLRGFRIELGEMEAVISQHPMVRENIVVAFEDELASKCLIAYVVLHPEQTVTVTELRHFLESKLPSYMVPSAFVMLEALPLTPNGKVDRRALKALDTTRFFLKEAFVAPRNPVEEVVAGIWIQVLGIELLGIDDNFFELGGHSLLATQVISRIWKTFEVELSLRRLFESPTVAGLTKAIQQAIEVKLGQQTPPIKRVSRDENIPLSFAQERLWLLEQLQPGSATYNIPVAVQLVGLLNLAALEESLCEIVQRHEVLRTTFPVLNGQPFQAIASTITLKLPVVDLRGLPEAEQKPLVQQLIDEESQRTFDLAQGPLLRCTIVRVSDQEHIVLFTIHHIVSDGWTMGVFIRELAALYEAFCAEKPSPFPELPIQYADFAVWQRQQLQGAVLEAQLAYWKQQLGNNLPVLQLPTTRPRTVVKTNRGATQSFLILSNTSQGLQALSRQEGVTLFMTLLAGFQVLLQRYTNQDDIVVGTDVANRNRAETEPLIGFFVNLLVLRTHLGGNPSFRELLKRVRSVALGAYAHQDLPFDKLVKALQPERNLSNTTPLFQVLFVLQNAPMPTLELPGLTLSLLEVENKIARFDLALFLTETKFGIEGKWQYNADLFDATIITCMTGHFQTLLNSIVSQPDARISNLEILTEAERKQQAMQKTERKAFNREKFISVAPKAVSLSQERLIKTDYLQPEQTFALVIQPDADEIDLVVWAKTNRELLERQLLKHGAILFRGFHVDSVSEFESVAQAIYPDLFGDYGDLPRAAESGKVYGSTPYPPDKAILFHNESSHLHQFPLKIWFFCVQSAEQGGETPIIDCRKAYQLLNPKLRELLAEKQFMYVRNYTNGLDVRWQDFFHTNDKYIVENYCCQAGIEFEWYDNNSLVTRQVRPVVAVHPKTGDKVFFNQIQLHHIAYLDAEVRESLLSLFGEKKLPRNVYYGDETPIEDSVISEINEVYQQSKTSFPWQSGDILMLDNMLAAHGRYPYEGQRKIVVAMGEMIQSKDIAIASQRIKGGSKC